MVLCRGNNMTNLDKLKAPPKRDSRCGTLTWLLAQETEVYKAVTAALENKDWKSTDLHQLLVADFGYPLGYNQFTRHRNGVCCG